MNRHQGAPDARHRTGCERVDGVRNRLPSQSTGFLSVGGRLEEVEVVDGAAEIWGVRAGADGVERCVRISGGKRWGRRTGEGGPSVAIEAVEPCFCCCLAAA